VAVAQLVEPRVVVPVVAGSSPVRHPFSARARLIGSRRGTPLDASVDTAAALELVDTSLPRRGPWKQAARRFRRRPLGLAALSVLLAIFVVGLLAKQLAPYPAGEEFLEFINRPQHPFTTPHHFLGTDVIGHDFLTQLLFGIRESVFASLVCAAGATAIGALVGVLAGFYGGVVDAITTWITGAVVSVPAVAVLLIIVIFRWPVTPFEFGLWLMVYLWTGVARVVRGVVVSLREREFVEAAHAAGASGPRVILRHLLPNASGPLIVAGTSLIGQSIVIVATVTFLGLGTVQAEKPSLGTLIADAARGTGGTAGVIVQSPWWLYVFPGAVLVVMLVCVNLLGDTLDEVLNPTSTRS
jgi:peptide/nickel transport system permease protein